MNACIKTGANVWLTSHDHIVHGDLYRVADLYVLRYLPGQAYRMDPHAALEAHALFDNARAEREDNQFASVPNTMPSYLDMEGAGVIIIHEVYVRNYLK